MTILKSKEEIENLKAGWRYDPCWDIEETEGFEAHYDELLAYRHKVEAEFAQARQEEINQKAATLKCGPELAKHIMYLERRIGELERALAEL